MELVVDSLTLDHFVWPGVFERRLCTANDAKNCDSSRKQCPATRRSRLGEREIKCPTLYMIDLAGAVLENLSCVKCCMH